MAVAGEHRRWDSRRFQMEAAFFRLRRALKLPHVCPCFGLLSSLGNSTAVWAKAARRADVATTWAKEKQPISDCSQIVLHSRQTGLHAQGVVVYEKGNGQRTVAAFIFHVIGLRPQIDQAWALLVCKEPNLLGVLSADEASVQV